MSKVYSSLLRSALAFTLLVGANFSAQAQLAPPVMGQPAARQAPAATPPPRAAAPVAPTPVPRPPIRPSGLVSPTATPAPTVAPAVAPIVAPTAIPRPPARPSAAAAVEAPAAAPTAAPVAAQAAPPTAAPAQPIPTPPRRPKGLPKPAAAPAGKKDGASLCAGCEVPKDPVATSAPAVVEAKQQAKEVLAKTCSPLGNASPKPGERQRFTPASFPADAAQAKATMESLMHQMRGPLAQAHSTTSGCPKGCTRVNNPELVIDTKPDVNLAPGQCPYSKYSAIQGLSNGNVAGTEPGTTYDGSAMVRTFKSDHPGGCIPAAQEWTKAIGMESNSLGKLAASLCTSPCSYATQTAFVEKAGVRGCEVLVKFTLQCGPPRQSGLFGMGGSWTARPEIKYNWSCKP